MDEKKGRKVAIREIIIKKKRIHRISDIGLSISFSAVVEKEIDKPIRIKRQGKTDG